MKTKIENILMQRVKENNFSGIWMPDNSFYFFVGSLVNRNIPLEKAWNFPYELSNRMEVKELTPELIEGTSVDVLKELVFKPKALHRYHYIVTQLKSSATQILSKYNGITENIWLEAKDVTDLYNRLLAFSGIGQKVSSMMILMLLESKIINFENKEQSELPLDTHVIRVLTRLGYIRKEMLPLAQKVSPEYPAKLDTVLFGIGTNVCYPRKPKCYLCPFNKYCDYNNKT